MLSSNKLEIFGIRIDKLTMSQTVDIISNWLVERPNHCRYVVTPNVDHVVKLSNNISFREAYEHASLIVADGRPIVWVSKLFGDELPSTVPGSDLVPEIFNRFQSNQIPLKVFLLGAMPGVAAEAALRIESNWSCVKVVGTLSPDFGFERKLDECYRICEEVTNSSADLLVLGLGAPKQELWIHKYSSQLNVKVALCVGATIDFLAGEKPRAPIWMRKCGIEWMHRMLSEPKRLAGRYFKDAIVFPKIVFKEWKFRNRKI